MGCSGFARRYYRNHSCFLFLWVLRWFTSPGSLPAPMDSERNNPCSHGLGSPIRTSPDHDLFAAPRGLSQLTTSFIAYLRQGIHTHALSSLTIKFTPHTEQISANLLDSTRPPRLSPPGRRVEALLSLVVARQYSVVKHHPDPAGIQESTCRHHLPCQPADCCPPAIPGTNGGPGWTRTTDLTLIRRTL